MYTPGYFEENDKKEIAKLIEQFPLATIVCSFNDEFIVNHIPLLYEKDDQYIGHIAKSNPFHKFFPNSVKAIAIFKAEDSYISPNWYPTKAKNHNHVPTWNYQVVHLKGNLSFSHSKKDKLSAIGKLTKKYEQKFFGKEAWKMSDVPRDYIEEMLEYIVAFKFKVSDITAKSKISQNREEIDFVSVKKTMDSLNKTFLASSMGRFIKDP